MDRLSSVLSAFRPKATSVRHVTLSKLDECLALSSDSSYWLYTISGSLTLTTQTNNQTELRLGDGVWLASGLELDVQCDSSVDEETRLLICEFDFGSKALNPLLDIEWQWIKVHQGDDISEQLTPINTLLLTESLQQRCGSQAVIERLAEAYLVQLLRLFMQTQKIQFGLLAGLSDSKLARAIVAIHEQPNQT